MAYTWQYPVFLIRCGDGFAAVEVDSDTDEQQFAVTVFTDEALCEQFVDNVGIDGTVVELKTEREFARLVAFLRPPFASVVFDSAPVDDQVNADWQVDIPTLLAEHLPLARSPWDYPLFVLRETDGYTSVRGSSDAGDTFVAVGIFTRRELADHFMSDAGLSATVIQLDDPPQLRALLDALDETVSTVAFNPTAEGDQRTAKHCVRIRDIRAKYLP